jgi:hypothetical protein
MEGPAGMCPAHSRIRLLSLTLVLNSPTWNPWLGMGGLAWVISADPHIGNELCPRPCAMCYMTFFALFLGFPEKWQTQGTEQHSFSSLQPTHGQMASQIPGVSELSQKVRALCYSFPQCLFLLRVVFSRWTILGRPYFLPSFHTCTSPQPSSSLPILMGTPSGLQSSSHSVLCTSSLLAHLHTPLLPAGVPVSPGAVFNNQPC